MTPAPDRGRTPRPEVTPGAGRERPPSRRMLGGMTSNRSLEALALTKTYGTATSATHALLGVDLTIRTGESVAIMGPSGSGKTTLLHLLAGVLAPTAGDTLWGGRSLGSMSDKERTALRRQDFGFVFQSGQLLPELPADENAALPLLLDGVARPEATARARQWLSHLGLGGMESRRPGELSGGQAQRVAIARALVGSPGVIFADEPTGALDRTTGWEVMKALTTAARAQGASLVVVTHDLEVARWCRRIVEMRDGRIVRELSQTAGDGGTTAQPGAPEAPQAHEPPQAHAVPTSFQAVTR
ncbi:ABC transporter [Serinibacter arcticus]|uniref:ABC transporter n=2 Tax=Serinibacter arcticus TaxID=1655435 RepID=A0A2U1ZX19_9MICO|nr:ABC transporter [Serinibacter arcticus]